MIKSLKKLSTSQNKTSFTLSQTDTTNKKHRLANFKKHYSPTPSNPLIKGQADQEGNNYFQSRNSKSNLKSPSKKLQSIKPKKAIKHH